MAAFKPTFPHGKLHIRRAAGHKRPAAALLPQYITISLIRQQKEFHLHRLVAIALLVFPHGVDEMPHELAGHGIQDQRRRPPVDPEEFFPGRIRKPQVEAVAVDRAVPDPFPGVTWCSGHIFQSPFMEGGRRAFKAL